MTQSMTVFVVCSLWTDCCSNYSIRTRDTLIFDRKRKKRKHKSTVTAENENGRKYQNMSFSAPKTKTNFGQPLVLDTCVFIDMSESVNSEIADAAYRLDGVVVQN